MVLDRDGSRLIKSLNVSNFDIEYLNCETTTGLLCKNNEDFAATIVSPINENYKLLVVCDGLGGENYGEEASMLVGLNLVEWFKSFDFNNLDFGIVKKLVIKELKEINQKLCKSYKGAATTLTAALVGENETLIINVGDSRTYYFTDGELFQVTKDDSLVWKLFYRNGKGKYKKDELRFLKLNGVITKYIGDIHYFKINTYMVNNNSYDGLLLLSDGVTDIVSDKRIQEILNEKEYLIFLKELLKEACYCDSEFFEDGTKEGFLKSSTIPGRDNATAAMYLKL